VVAPSTLELGEDAGLEVLGELGRGDQAVVHHARRGGADYAVKVMRSDGGRHADAVRDFHRQAALLARTDDPGLPRVYASGTTVDGNPYMVMDFIPGDRLDSRIAAGRFAEAAVHRARPLGVLVVRDVIRGVVSGWYRVRPGSSAGTAVRNSPCCCPASPPRPMPQARPCGRPWPTGRSPPGAAR
jgi:hypothetical protein